MQDQTWKVKDAEEKLRKAEAALKEKEVERKAAQTELDDLFVLLSDLEEKRAKDKVSCFFFVFGDTSWFSAFNRRNEYVAREWFADFCDRNGLRNWERRFRKVKKMTMTMRKQRKKNKRSWKRSRHHNHTNSCTCTLLL